MKSTKRFNFNRIDYFFLFFSAGASLAISWVLTFHKFTVDGANVGEPIATISDVENSIRRKPSSLSFWLDLENDDSLYSNDKIFTDNNSQMKINFNDGAEVDVGENALLVLQEGDDSSIQLNLEQGLIKGSAGYGKLKISAQGITSELSKGSVVEFKKAKDGSLSVASLKGNVTVETLDGKSSVAEGSYVQQSDKGLKLKEYPIKAKSPSVGEKIFLSPGERVEFRFEGELKGDEYLKISKAQKEFKDIKLSSLSSKVQLGTGSYEYVVSSKDGENQYSLQKNFRVIDLSPTKLLSPANGAVISFIGKTVKGEYSARTDLRLDWRAQNVVNYQVSIARDKEFKKLWLDRKVKNNSLSILGISEGQYFVRIKSIFEDGKESKWTNTYSFKLKEKPLAKTPRILEPANGKAYTAVDGEKKVEISWEFSPDSSYIDIKVSNSPEFNADRSESFRSEKTSYTYYPKSKGKYYVKIRSIGKDGRRTKWGSPILFVVNEKKLDLPLEAPSKLSSVISKDNSVVISWNKVKSAIAYRVQISMNADFTKLVGNQKSKSEKIRLAKMKKKKYFFRVSAIDAKAKQGYWSQPEVFDLREKDDSLGMPLASNFDAPPATGVVGAAAAGAALKLTEGASSGISGFFSNIFSNSADDAEKAKLAAKKAEDIEKDKAAKKERGAVKTC